MNLPTPKLKAILLYFANCTDTKFLGKVKLMKLFYFLDFMHLKTYGTPVTYDTYINMDHGPIPTTIKNLIDDAADDIEHSILADTIYFERPSGTNMFRVMPIRKPTKKDESYLSQNELDIINKICPRFGDKTTKQTEEVSHSEAPWKNTKFLEKIPYTLAADDADSLVTREELELLEQI